MLQNRKLRWQYSIRTLLLCIAFSSLIFAYLRSAAVLRRQAARQLLEIGIDIGPMYERSVEQSRWERLFHDPLSEELALLYQATPSVKNDFVQVKKFPTISSIGVSGSTFDQITGLLKQIDNPDAVKFISISKSSVNEGCFESLARFTSLKRLQFRACNISADSIQALPALPELEHVSFGYCKDIGDDDIHLLCGRLGPNVNSIEVDGTDITDVGLASLCSISSLKSLSLYSTQIDGSGLEALTNKSSLQNLDLGKTCIRPNNLDNLLRITTERFRLSVRDTSLRRKDVKKLEDRWAVWAIEVDG
ncbi:MAG: hypothetical protein ACO1RA_14275 [Planctomycetaceae bacterium]